MTYDELYALLMGAVTRAEPGIDLREVIKALERNGLIYKVNDEYQQFPIEQKSRVKLPKQCIIPDCVKRARTHGYCQTHYLKARRAGQVGESSECSIESCTNPVEAKGLCFTHYRKAHR